MNLGRTSRADRSNEIVPQRAVPEVRPAILPPKIEFRDIVFFRSDEARASLLRGESCRVSVAIFPDNVRVIAIGLIGSENFSHKKILGAACVHAERTPNEAVSSGGGFVCLRDSKASYTGTNYSETLKAGIPEEHKDAVLLAIEASVADSA